MTNARLALLAFAICILMLLSSVASARIVMLRALLDCLHANAGQSTCNEGAKGSGTAVLTLDTDTNMLSWDISWRNTTGAITVAHFHGPAIEDAVAPPTLNFGAISGLQSPSIGMGMISQDEAADLLAGLWYLNLHTTTFPMEEIRGQVRPRVIELEADLDCSQASAGQGTCGLGATGTGHAVMSIETGSNTLTWNISWEGLIGLVSVGDFHGPAPADDVAPTTLNFGPISGLISPSAGMTVISQQAVDELEAGLWYIDVHSTSFPTGEIRGQVPEPDKTLMLGFGLLSLGGVAHLRRLAQRRTGL